MNECLEFNVELCFVLPLEHLCNKKKDLKGYCGIYHNPAANGQQTHGGNYTVSMHITAVMLNSAFICSAQLLKNSVSAPLSMFDMSILLLPFSVQLFAVSCNGCHWRLKSPNYPFMGFYDIDLALCSMCNMYRNTVHLCIYCQKNVQHVAHKTGTIWVFFLRFCNISTGIVVLVLD